MSRFLPLTINTVWFLIMLNLPSIAFSLSSRIGGHKLHISSIQFSEKVVDLPEARINAALTMTEKGEINLFGGVNNKGVYSNDFYRYENQEWIKILESKHSPGSRELANLFSDANGNIYMIGGKRFESPNKDILVYTPSKNEWNKLNFNYSMLPSLKDHSTQFDKDNLIFYLVGGYINDKANSDVFALGIKDLSIKRIDCFGPNPFPISFPIIHYFQNKLFVYGGYKASGEFNQEMFTLDFEAKNEWRNANLVFVDEKSTELFNANLLNIKGVGDNDIIYIYSPSNSLLFKIQISDYSSIEYSHSVKAIPSGLFGYNILFYGQKLYFYGGYNEKEYLNTIQAVSVKVPSDYIENPNYQETKVLQLDKKSLNNQEAIKDSDNCPNACSGSGQCLHSMCQCASGFTGKDCSVQAYHKSFEFYIEENIKYVIGLVSLSLVFILIYYLKNSSKNQYF